MATPLGDYDYDYLIIATGYQNVFDVVPGLGPGGNASTISTLEDAVKAGEAWKRFLDDPGPIVIGATPPSLGHMLPPRKHSVMIPGPQAHAMKVAFEKYFLWKARHGHVNLP